MFKRAALRAILRGRLPRRVASRGMDMTPRWSDDLKDAIRAAAILPGETARSITDKANAGTLAPGLPAAAIPQGTVRDLVTKARRRAAADGDGLDAKHLGDAVTSAAEEISAMLGSMVRNARGRMRGGNLKPADLRDLAATAREVAKLERETRDALRSNGTTRGETEPDETEDEPLDSVGALAAELAAAGPRETAPSEAGRHAPGAAAPRDASDAGSDDATTAGRSDARPEDVRRPWHEIEADAAASPTG